VSGFETAAFRWEDIDHSLASLRLTDLAEEMQRQICEDENRIRFENRGNLNSNALPSLLLKMKQDRADDQARRVYETYCDIWEKQGHVKSAAFVRAVYARAVVSVLRARTNAIASEFARFATRTNFHPEIGKAHLQSLRQSMQRLEDRWRRRVEIEAKECEHAEQRLRQAQQIVQRGDVATTRAPAVLPELNLQLSAGAYPPPVQESAIAPKRSKPGRYPKLPQDFVVCAATLWRGVLHDSHSKVSNDQLRQIAHALDAAMHLPPSDYLEGKYAREIKEFNSRHSKSKTRPILTWSDLVGHQDKDHLQGMRRLLSRCARRIDHDHPPSGINSGRKRSS
jgi:hypothetical protein